MNSNTTDNNLYDIEFLGLLQEINSRVSNLKKGEILKVNSWTKNLMIPTKSIERKKKRNLISIKLLDNIINNKLEEPFTNFCKNSDLEYIPLSKLKSELSEKFYSEISFEKIEQIGKEEYKKIKQNEIDIGRNIINSAKITDGRLLYNINKNDYTISQKKKIEFSRIQLESMINKLNEENESKQQIINKQNKEINILKKKINELETKAKLIVGNQMKKLEKDNKNK